MCVLNCVDFLPPERVFAVGVTALTFAGAVIGGVVFVVRAAFRH